MKYKDVLKLDLLFFSKKTFLLLFLFFLLNSVTTLCRYFFNGNIPLTTLFYLFGSALLPTLFLYLPVRKKIRICAAVLIEFVIFLFQTFYDFCFFITGSDITKEVLGNLGILQINAAFVLWDVWCFLGIIYILFCTTVSVLLAIFYPVPENGQKMHWYLPTGIFVVGICCLLNIPVLQVLFSTNIRNDHYTLKEYAESGIKYSPLNKNEITASPGKNIVHIYLESFDTRFLNEKRFPGLLPNLQRLIKEGLFFSRISNAPLAHYTFGGDIRIRYGNRHGSGTFLSGKRCSWGNSLSVRIPNALSSVYPETGRLCPDLSQRSKYYVCWNGAFPPKGRCR